MGERTDAVRRALGGIRTRVVVGYVVLVTLVLAAAVLVTRQVLLNDLNSRIERDLVQEAEEIRRLTSADDPVTGEPFGPDAAAIFDMFLSRNVPSRGEAFFTLVDGEPYRHSSDPPAQLLSHSDLLDTWMDPRSTVRRTVETEAGETRTLAVPLREGGEVRGVFVVAAFPQEELDQLNHAVRILVLASLLLVAASAAVAWWLAGGVIRPVRELAATAGRITESDLSARLPVGASDELAALSRAFNDMVDRVALGASEQQQLLDDVAHKLRTPLTTIDSHLELLGDSNDPDERARSIAVVTDELDRMSRYMSDLLLLARIGEPDVFRFEPVDVGELARSLMHHVEALGSRRWVLDEAPEAGHVAAVLDVDRIEQAVVSLADNAVQHTGEGDEIGLGIRVDYDRLRIWVRGSGPGIDPEVRDEIFQRRGRGSSSGTALAGGMGVGLSAVAAIARAHLGEAQVTSTPGEGATFTLDLPLNPQEHLR